MFFIPNFLFSRLDDDLYGTRAKDNQVKTLSSRKADEEGHVADAIADALFRITLCLRFRRRGESQSANVEKLINDLNAVTDADEELSTENARNNSPATSDALPASVTPESVFDRPKKFVIDDGPDGGRKVFSAKKTFEVKRTDGKITRDTVTAVAVKEQGTLRRVLLNIRRYFGFYFLSPQISNAQSINGLLFLDTTHFCPIFFLSELTMEAFLWGLRTQRN